MGIAAIAAFELWICEGKSYVALKRSLVYGQCTSSRFYFWHEIFAFSYFFCFNTFLFPFFPT